MGRGALGREAQKGETLDDFVVVVVVERTRKDHRQTEQHGGCFKGSNRESSVTGRGGGGWGGANMRFPERVDTISI